MYEYIPKHTHTHTHTPLRMPIVFNLEPTPKALKLVLNKGAAIITFTTITFYKLHQNICHLKIMKNVYVYLLGYLTN